VSSVQKTPFRSSGG